MITNPNWISNTWKNHFVDKYNLHSLNEITVVGSKLSENTTKQFLKDFPRVKLFQAYGKLNATLCFY